MELRPRRGRSSQLPSTPTIPKPSPRPPPQSSARKKTGPPPATPIHIPSDDEDADAKDAVGAAHHETALKQNSSLPDDSEFETPLSSVAKVRRLRNKLASSNAKRKNKVTSSVNKIAEETENFSMPAAPQDSTCVADSSTAVSEKAGLDAATTRKVSRDPNGDVALKETETPEVLTENASRDCIELAGEISVMVQEASVKKGEVLSPRSKGQAVQSSKKKSGKKKKVEDTGVTYKVANAKMDQVNDQEHYIDVDAPTVTEFQECHGALSLILSDDETAQVSDVTRVVGCEVKASASREAALVKHGQAEISKASSKGKKSQSNKKDTGKEEKFGRKLFEETNDTTSQSKKKDTIKEKNFGRKLFEETDDATLAYMDKEPEDQFRHKSGTTTNLSKEGERKIDVVNINKYGERVISKSLSGSSQENEVTDLEMSESNSGKLGTSAAGIEGDFGNECVHDVSEDSSHGTVASSDERDDDTGNDCDGTSEVKHEEAKTCSEGTAVQDETWNNTDDDDNDNDGNASSGNDDDDDDEDEMASVFVNVMKAHLQKISEPSAISMPKETQARQEALERTESPFTKSAVKAPCVNGSNGSTTGYGLSWSPDIVLSASKNHSAQAGKARNTAEARPNTIWGRDQCLQDGLCVPPMDPLKLNKLAKKKKDDTTGAKWFNLSAPTITPELKKELQLLKLRGALDPKRHYKAEDSKGLPKYFQVGTVVGGPADFYSGRLTKKEQKSSLADELLADSSLTYYRKRKYTEIQDQKQAGGKGFWKQKKSKRTPAWKKI